METTPREELSIAAYKLNLDQMVDRIFTKETQFAPLPVRERRGFGEGPLQLPDVTDITELNGTKTDGFADADSSFYPGEPQ